MRTRQLNKYFSGFALCLLFGSASMLLGAQTSKSRPTTRVRGVAEIAKASEPAIVLIMTADASGNLVAQGSGFIISSDGKVVTNHHVIAAAATASVKMSNGGLFPVEGVLAQSEKDDLAVLKISGNGLPFLALGEVKNVSIGDKVIAIGSPLGLEGTVTDGIVSAKREEEGNAPLIQTTAAISHGSSGGPLLDLSGNVVGILTFKFKGGENLNFAVSINALKPLLVSTSKPLPLSSLTASPTDLSDKEALSKSYWKAAATALSSIQDWRDKAFTAFTSSDYSNGEVYINRTAADRASDALTKAKLDVKLAKAEVSVPADKQVQDRLEIYLDAAETMGQGQIHLDRSVISDDLTSKLAGCRAALEAVLDAGSNKTFSEHPNMCPAH